jgi:hypothetical protein
MRKLSWKHIHAVNHAIDFIKPLSKKRYTEKHHTGIDYDLRLLGEVTVMLQRQLVNPDLPFELPEVPIPFPHSRRAVACRRSSGSLMSEQILNSLDKELENGSTDAG